MTTYELHPQYDVRQSFYGKAKVLKDGKTIQLKSYDTIVAIYDCDKREVKVNGWYSTITARHINEFLRQYGFSPRTKQELEGGITINHNYANQEV